MARSLVFILLVVIVLLLSALFASQNPGLIELDLIFAKVEVLKSLAFTMTLAVGWLLGILSAGLYIVRSMRERRKLTKAIKLAEVELKNLRSLPMQDAG
ncbi:MAG: LapA family protein [Gammaproteobacteria bacterium]|nr:LapA family protein [Gammaproteobacteria bacterium]